MHWAELFTKTDDPSWQEIDEFINNPLWAELNKVMQNDYAIKPKLSYSACSMQKGWNIKYKKSGKVLCTAYPMPGYFFALVCLHGPQLDKAEKVLPACSHYVQELYQQTKTVMGGKWLMIKVNDSQVLKDALAFMALKLSVK